MKKNNTPLSRNVANKISAMIIDEKKYLPNDKLPNERVLAEELSVSRTSIREAIKLLVSSGMLTVRRGVGTFVNENPGISMDPLGLSHLEDKKKLILQWFEVRLILESESVRLVVERATDEEIEEIIAWERKGAELIEKGEDYVLADQHFHAAIAKATHNEVIKRFIPSIESSVYEALSAAQEGAWFNRSTENALKYHHEIANFIKMRDSAGAVLAMRYHMLKAIDDIKSMNLNNNI
jgi:GntR family transcriptional repressor for pyruvate dehydrogenase complex